LLNGHRRQIPRARCRFRELVLQVAEIAQLQAGQASAISFQQKSQTIGFFFFFLAAIMHLFCDVLPSL
jgi:hypothetical protein